MDPPVPQSTAFVQKKKNEKERRSSILKPCKLDDDYATTQTANFGRRVSFADTHQVQEFVLCDSGNSENSSDFKEPCPVGEYPVRFDSVLTPNSSSYNATELNSEFRSVPVKPTSIDDNSAEMSLTQTIDNTIHCPKGIAINQTINKQKQSKSTDNYRLENMDLSQDIAVKDMTLTRVIKTALSKDDIAVDGRHSRYNDTKNQTQYSRDMSLDGAINKTIISNDINDENIPSKSSVDMYSEKENVNINQLPEVMLIPESNKSTNMDLTRFISKNIHESSYQNDNDLEKTNDSTKYGENMSLASHFDKSIYQLDYPDNDECFEDPPILNTSITSQRNNQDNAVSIENFQGLGIDDMSLTRATDHPNHQDDSMVNSSPITEIGFTTKYSTDMSITRHINKTIFIPNNPENVLGYLKDPVNDSAPLVIEESRANVSEDKDSNLLIPKSDATESKFCQYAELSKPVSLKKRVKVVKEVPRVEDQRRNPNVNSMGIGIGLFSKQNQNLRVYKPGSSVASKVGHKLVEPKRDLPPEEVDDGQPPEITNHDEDPAVGNIYEHVVADNVKPIGTPNNKNGNASKPNRKLFKMPPHILTSNVDRAKKLDQKIQQKQKEIINLDSGVKIDQDKFISHVIEENYSEILLNTSMPVCSFLNESIEIGRSKQLFDEGDDEKEDLVNATAENCNPHLQTDLELLQSSTKVGNDSVHNEKRKICDSTKLASKNPKNSETNSRVIEEFLASFSAEDDVSCKTIKTDIVSKTVDHPSKIVATASIKPKTVKPSSTKPKTVDTSSNKPKMIDQSSNTPKTVDTSSNKPKTVDTSSNKPKTVDTSSNKPKMIDQSATKPKTVDTSFKKPKTVDTSFKKPKTVDTSGTKPKAIDTSDTKPKAIDTAGTKLKAIDTSDTKPKAIDTSDTKPKAIDASATKPIAIDASAFKPIAIDSSGTKPIAINTSGTKPIAIDTSGTKPIAIDTSGTKPEAIETSGTKHKADDSSSLKTSKPKFKSKNSKCEAKNEVAKRKNKFAVPGNNKQSEKYPRKQLKSVDLNKPESSVLEDFKDDDLSLVSKFHCIDDGDKAEFSEITLGDFKPSTSSTVVIPMKDLKTCMKHIMESNNVKNLAFVKEYLEGGCVIFGFFEHPYEVRITFLVVNNEWFNTSILAVNLQEPPHKLDKFEALAFSMMKYLMKRFNFEKENYKINELPKCLWKVNDVMIVGSKLLRDCKKMDAHYEVLINEKEDHAEMIEEMHSISHRIIYDVIYTISYENYSVKPIIPIFVDKMGNFSHELKANLLKAIESEQIGDNCIYSVSQIIKQYLRNNPVYNKPPPNKQLLSWLY